jgi:nitrate/TMAO reductase-like tetraheme cytochrome c subunit
MRRIAFTVLMAIVLLVAGGTATWAQPPDAHQAMGEFTGPETCAMCHPNAAQEVVESVHYQQQAIPKYREGWPEGQPGGMYVSY